MALDEKEVPKFVPPNVKPAPRQLKQPVILPHLVPRPHLKLKRKQARHLQLRVLQPSVVQQPLDVRRHQVRLVAAVWHAVAPKRMRAVQKVVLHRQPVLRPVVNKLMQKKRVLIPQLDNVPTDIQNAVLAIRRVYLAASPPNIVLRQTFPKVCRRAIQRHAAVCTTCCSKAGNIRLCRCRYSLLSAYNRRHFCSNPTGQYRCAGGKYRCCTSRIRRRTNYSTSCCCHHADTSSQSAAFST